MDYSKPITAGPSSRPSGALLEGGAAAIILLSNRDSATFAERVANQAHGARRASTAGEDAPCRSSRCTSGRSARRSTKPASTGERIRASTAAVTRDLPDLILGFDLKDQVLDSASAPNTIGILEGTDPQLKHEYLVFSAHMDHVGTAGGGQCQARGGDSICNGADDDGSGTVSVIELAEAFSQPGARPKRSVIFMTVSGEEKGLCGSGYFAEHPTVPLGQVVANLNIDMIGRNWPDTIVAIGKEHSDLGATPRPRAGNDIPDLRMAAIDDRWPEENFYFRSDHYNFARKGVPILFFFNGIHPDYHQVTDSPGQDRRREAIPHRAAPVLPRAGDRQQPGPARSGIRRATTKIVEQKPAA